MSEQLKPGLYRATVRSVPDQIVMVNDDGNGFTINKIGVCGGHVPSLITDARPLIVLDLADYDAGYVIEVLRHPHHLWANRVADQIEAQTKPARIPEPEPGEHVTACARPTPDQPEEFLRLRWSKTRDEEGWHWVALATGHVYEWHNLIDPTLVREGVESS